MTYTTPRPLFSAQRWGELRSLFDELAGTTVEAREARLAELARDNDELASALRELLADFPEQATSAPERVIERLMPESRNEAPSRIGPFRLLHRISAGGMGVIYLAEREQVDFTQQVALKLLDGGSARVARLAARERRILAALTHPNITAFVDAGSIDGRAWMAMEHVDGKPLLEHCRQHEFDVRDRVQLFDQICSAVAHAHAQLVVHRDLKPSNVLVTQDGRAKLLDFGIALMIDAGDDSEPATRVFTPEYAAPEQLRGERASTATDIYSLGLILFELISGHRLPTLEHGIGQREWNTTELARFATTRESERDPQHARQADTKTIRTLLRGDLGRIIAHTLSPDPQQRYASVTSLREDLARWLDFRPLGIGHPRLGYVFKRFVQRHRVGTALAGFAFVSLLGLGAIALWQAHAKSIEAERARTALRQSEASRQFMSSIFFSADPIMGRGMQATASELLTAARVRIDKQLADQPDIAAELLHQIGNVYVSSGDDAATRETLGKALAFNARRAQPSIALEGSVQARIAFMDYLESHAPADLRRIESAVAKLRAGGEEARAGLADALRMFGNALFNEGRGDEAIAAESEAVRIFEPLGGEYRPIYLTAMLALSDLFASLDRNQEALASADQALADPFLKSADGRELGNELLGARARGLMGLHRYVEAEAAMRQVIQDGTQALGFEHSSIRYWRYRRVQVLVQVGRLDEARAEIEKLLQVPASGTEQPIARVAHAVTRLGIDVERRDAVAAAELGPALAAACSEAGNPLFCAKTRLLGAELAIRNRDRDHANSALDACAVDPVIEKDVSLQRRLALLRARLARQDDQLDVALAGLDQLKSAADLSDDENAQITLERGFLALASNDARQAIESLQAARLRLAEYLEKPTPLIDEIDTALALAARMGLAQREPIRK